MAKSQGLGFRVQSREKPPSRSKPGAFHSCSTCLIAVWVFGRVVPTDGGDCQGDFRGYWLVGELCDGLYGFGELSVNRSVVARVVSHSIYSPAWLRLVL